MFIASIPELFFAFRNALQFLRGKEFDVEHELDEIVNRKNEKELRKKDNQSSFMRTIKHLGSR